MKINKSEKIVDNSLVCCEYGQVHALCVIFILNSCGININSEYSKNLVVILCKLDFISAMFFDLLDGSISYLI